MMTKEKLERLARSSFDEFWDPGETGGEEATLQQFLGVLRVMKQRRFSLGKIFSSSEMKNIAYMKRIGGKKK